MKVNAYLKQRLGFENIGRLEKGIIAYENYIDAINNDVNNTGITAPVVEASSSSEDNNNNKEPSLFAGKNFLFDRRRLLEDEQLMEEDQYYK